MENRIFFPLDSVEEWANEGKVEVKGNDLVVVADARRYRLEDAAHIVREVSGSECPRGLPGKVKSKTVLEEWGAELYDTSMVLGDNAYDVIQGWMGTPASSFAEHRKSTEAEIARKSRPDDEPTPENDEAILARYLLSLRGL
jgi:hypothetical protein